MLKNIKPRIPYWAILAVELKKESIIPKKLAFSELMKEGRRITPGFLNRKINI